MCVIWQILWISIYSQTIGRAEKNMEAERTGAGCRIDVKAGNEYMDRIGGERGMEMGEKNRRWRGVVLGERQKDTKRGRRRSLAVLTYWSCPVKHVGEGVNVSARDGGSSRDACMLCEVLSPALSLSLSRGSVPMHYWSCWLVCMKRLQDYTGMDVAALQKSYLGSMYTSHFQVLHS